MSQAPYMSLFPQPPLLPMPHFNRHRKRKINKPVTRSATASKRASQNHYFNTRRLQDSMQHYRVPTPQGWVPPAGYRKQPLQTARWLGKESELDDAVAELLKLIDYNLIGLEVPEVEGADYKIVLSDALKCLELLSLTNLGKETWYSYRFFSERELWGKLKETVPMKFWTEQGMREVVLMEHVRSFPKPVGVVRATVGYLADVVRERQREMGEKESMGEAGKVDERGNTMMTQLQDEALEHLGQNDQGVRSAAKGQNEQVVERPLSKIDKWCDLWLQGELAGNEDWKTFGLCLEIPD